MAAGYLQHLAGDRIEVLSAGSQPADQVNPAAVEAMAEEGIDIARRAAQAAHRRGRADRRRRHHHGLRRRVPVLPGQALRGLGPRRPRGPGHRGGPPDPRRDPHAAWKASSTSSPANPARRRVTRVLHGRVGSRPGRRGCSTLRGPDRAELLVVLGDPGTGKTALLTDVLDYGRAGHEGAADPRHRVRVAAGVRRAAAAAAAGDAPRRRAAGAAGAGAARGVRWRPARATATGSWCSSRR